MNFSEQPPSKQWAALKYRGEKIAEVWFKPEDEPLGLTFRIPQQSFQIPGMDQQLTTENLLKAVGIASEAVESWRFGDVSTTDDGRTNDELKSSLAPPPPDVPHVEIQIRLKAPDHATASHEGAEREISSAKWQDMEARWKAILGLEATLETLRISMEGVRSEMEGASKKMLTGDEKLHAMRADVAQWTKAKSRVHHVLPRAREFIHRSVWALGSPERKKLEELYKNNIQPRIPVPQMEKLLEQLENMLKDRQVQCAHGTAVFQECKGIAAEVQGALRMLQSNAAANALKKRGTPGGKGKFFSR